VILVNDGGKKINVIKEVRAITRSASAKPRRWSKALRRPIKEGISEGRSGRPPQAPRGSRRDRRGQVIGPAWAGTKGKGGSGRGRPFSSAGG
jgi:hypothetical protein